MNKKKILFTASIAKHILRFHLPYLEWFQQQGFETHVACAGDEKIPFTDHQWNVPFIRSPFSLGHVKAYKELKKIIELNNYELINCHTPMASLVTRRAAARSRQNGTKVLYTAHGFHFYNGASMINWLTYYPIELYATKWADAIITINNEDFERIKSKGSPKTDYYIIPGIGVNGRRFSPVSTEEKLTLREKKGFAPDDFLLVYAAEFIDRKNHKFIIESVPEIIKSAPDIKFLFCGRGELKEEMEALVNKMGINDYVKFLGFRDDIEEIFKVSDIGISSSRQEGLPINLVEVMMCGLPVLATVERGHKEIIVPGENGFMFGQGNTQELVKYLTILYNDENLRKAFGSRSITIAANFEIKNSLSEMAKIYKKYLS